MAEPLLFEAVLFDLDGTLVATDRYWIPAARRAVRRALAEFGVELEIPEARAWLRIVGVPLEDGLRQLLPALDDGRIAILARYCVEEEEALLSAGGAALLPGVRETLDELRGAGVKLGIASNCGASYLEHVIASLGLERWISEARCLDSPGVSDKGDMLADLLCSFDTRNAVMVGDRLGDEHAARSNAIPHVHVRTGYADAQEGDSADLVLEDMSELVPRLRGRARALGRVLDQLGLAGRRASLGVTGRRGSGKSLVAADLARLHAARGGTARVVELESFRVPGRLDESDPLGSAFEVARLVEELLEPHARAETEELLILEGAFLLDPRIATRLSRLLYVDAPPELRMARLAGRDARWSGPAVLERAREELALEERFESRFPPRRADLVLDGRVFPRNPADPGP